MEPSSPPININIGLLGHVDSGKTSLSRALSSISSTASFDRNPQSQQRGITLDLGFSAFLARKENTNFQFTLVDCPGHASLIRTVLAGANIIDLMILVLDVNKGIQTQTAECLVIGEILIPKMIVVLNKIDLIKDENKKIDNPNSENNLGIQKNSENNFFLSENQQKIIEKKIEALRKVFSKTKFGSNVSIVPLAANSGEGNSLGLQNLVDEILKTIDVPKRNNEGEFYFLIDHCFPIKGQGTVVTGTVIQGKVKNGDEIEFPQLNEKRKVKGIQMFKKPVEKAGQGDRIGMLFPGLDSDKIERGIACQPGFVKSANALIINVSKVIYYKNNLVSKSKFHITSDHQTVMGTIIFFRQKTEIVEIIQKKETDEKSFSHKKTMGKLSMGEDYLFMDEIKNENNIFALILLEKELLCSDGGLIIGAKLDSDINSNSCRIAFHGNIIEIIKKKEELDLLKVCKEKEKKGQIDKIIDNHMILVKNLFKKQNNINDYIGKFVFLSNNGLKGKIHSSFGQTGKVKIAFDSDILEVKEEQKENELVQEILKGGVVMKYNKYLKLKLIQ